MRTGLFWRVAAEAVTDAIRARVLPSVDRTARPRPDGEPLRVIFTIDTEISMGGAARDAALAPVGARRRIWGETDAGRYGISYFMDVFEAHRMRGVFFFEPVARHVVPEAELEEAARSIATRGHDVELHVHPEFEMDLAAVQRGEAKSPSARLFEHSPAEQRRYVKESIARLERWTGRRPCAFRAGGYSAGDETLRALEAEGVGLDSSYNLWAIEAGHSTLSASPPLNDVALLGDTLEVPVTNLMGRHLQRPKAAGRVPFLGSSEPALRPLELSSLDATEVITALEQLYAAGARVACAVTHSFRLVRTTDVQYRDARPDPINIHRLRALCRYLDRHRDRFEVTTFQHLPVQRWRRDLDHARSEPYFPCPPAWTSALRMVVQGVKDRGVL